MSEDQLKAEKFRLEAAEIREAAAIVQDKGFREQLLSIADQYEALATSTEGEHERQRVQMASPPTLTTDRTDPNGRDLPGQPKPDQGDHGDEYNCDHEADKPARRIG